ncbi:hypothetical protein HUJ04_011566 [Dendroctonus ponderosae]|nr:hypothetical protein HUJ04_011566 [Dendroctonus ponderosae]
MTSEERQTLSHYLTIYNKDYVKRKINRIKKGGTSQEFKDPVCEGFRNFLELDKDDSIQPPNEAGEDYLEKMKQEKPKIAQMFFQNPLDRLTIKGDQILNGKSVYQVDYCDIEADIRRKLMENQKKTFQLPVDWDIPLTSQRCDFRPPLVLSQQAMDKPLVIKHPDNLGENEKINDILQVKTGDSEYNQVIGKLGDFIVNEEMHGKIDHPECGCLQHK